MLIDHLELRRLAERFNGLRRPIRCEMAIFFEHAGAARRFTEAARRSGYITDRAGTQAYIYGWSEDAGEGWGAWVR